MRPVPCGSGASRREPASPDEAVGATLATCLEPPAATPATWLERAAARAPDAPALVWDHGRLTCRELDQAAEAAAANFREAARRTSESEPVVDGSAVGARHRARESPVRAAPPAASGSHAVAALSLAPGPQAATALFGLWKAGFVAVPLHERLSAEETNYALRLLRPALRLDDRGEPAPARPRGHALSFADFPEVSAVLLTSGSSGAPKAVGLTTRALAASVAGAAHRLSLRPGACWGLCLSLGHVGGLALLLRALATGASVRCWPTFDARAVADAVLAGQVTHLSVVPVMLRRLLDALGGRKAPASLRCVLTGGAAASRPLLERAWRAGVPAAPTWGMTETASQIATAPPELARRPPGTAGPPLPDLEVRADAAGRLHVRGPTLAAALVRAPDAPPEPLPLDADGWFRTPDTGRVDADGHVHVEGRADDVITTGGLNVAPREVERVIEAMPGVGEAVVFGVPDPDWGQVVAAVVEAADGDVAPEGVDRHCRARLVRGRCPSRIRVVDALPRTQTGKVMRARVAERFGATLGST